MPGPGFSLFSNITNVLSEPIFKGALYGAFSEFMEFRPKRPGGLEDESIGSFVSRRFGSAIADNVLSAVIHGIYAGDIYKLSARTILPGPWHMESAHGSVLEGMLRTAATGQRPVATDDVEIIKEFNSRPTMTEPLEAVKKSLPLKVELGNWLIGSRPNFGRILTYSYVRRRELKECGCGGMKTWDQRYV